MPDDIERTIYKLEIDDSGYIRGVDAMSESTKRFVEVQAEANKRLQTNETALKSSSDFVAKAKKDLDAYTGSNEAYRKQLAKTFDDAQADNIKLTGLVNESRKAYEAATKAATDFASSSQRAANVQSSTTNGKIPTAVPLGVQTTPVTDMFKDISGLPDIVAESTNEFDQLRVAIALVEERMLGLDAASDEFKALAPIVEQGKKALQDYDNVVKVSATGTKSFRQEIADANLELKKLEEQGKGNSQEFIDQEKKVAQLTDAYEKQRARIKVLASDTRALDFGKAAIQAAISGFQAYTAVSILAGGASEKLQKQTLQLFAAMQLLTSLDQLANTVKRGSTIATNLQSAAQATYTAVVGASTGALRVFRTALLATGIGAAIVGIGFLVNKLSSIAGEADKAGEAQKRLNDVMNGAKDSYVRAVTEVENLKIAFEEVGAGIRTQESAVKLYNETIGKTTGAVKTLDEAEQALAKNADDYIQFTLLKAAAQIALGKASEEAFNIQQKVETTTRRNVGQELQLSAGRSAAEAARQAQIAGASEGEIRAAYDEAFRNALAEGRAGKEIDAKKSFENIVKNLQAQAKSFAIKLGVKYDVETPNTQSVENVFAAKLKELQARLAEVTAKSFESEGTIRKQFAASLEKEIASINQLLKDKKLTANQAQILINLTTKINDVQLNEALKVFSKKVQDARQKIQDELDALQSKVALDSINLIQDEFQRRAAIIDFNEKKELADAEKFNKDRLAILNSQKDLIGKKAYYDALAVIIAEGETNINNIIAKFNQARQDLSEDTFDKLLENLGNSLNERDVEAAETLAIQIQDEKDKLNAGVISQKKFEDNVTAITKAAIDFRTGLRRKELDLQLQAVNVALESAQDANDPKRIEELKKKQLELREAIATIDTDAAKSTETTKKVDTVQSYVEAIGSLTDSIISFWQKANEAEAQALDRSIAIQEKRVDAAQRIAERGNAQYLKAETDRLKELQVARENAARRELAINAALQASQLLVGITGAITKIATPGVGTADVIAAIAVIFAALATGYGLVKSLQGNQPQFKEGTKRVTRTTQPAGTDTIQAWVSEGEAIIPARTNKEYHPAVSAIYDKRIPAEVINTYVNNYVNNRRDIVETVTRIHTIKPIPQPNYQRIGQAATTHIQHDSKLAGLLVEQNRKIEENNDLQRATIRALQKMGVSVNMDRNGIAVSVMEVIEQQRKDSKT